MKLKFETTENERMVFGFIFSMFLCACVWCMMFLSAYKLDLILNEDLKMVVGYSMPWVCFFVSVAIFKHYLKKYK